MNELMEEQEGGDFVSKVIGGLSIEQMLTLI